MTDLGQQYFKLIAGGASLITALLALAASQNWGLALLIGGLVAALMTIWYLVLRRFADQDRKIDNCEKKHAECEERFMDFLRKFIHPDYHGPLRRETDKDTMAAASSVAEASVVAKVEH